MPARQPPRMAASSRSSTPSASRTGASAPAGPPAPLPPPRSGPPRAPRSSRHLPPHQPTPPARSVLPPRSRPPAHPHPARTPPPSQPPAPCKPNHQPAPAPLSPPHPPPPRPPPPGPHATAQTTTTAMQTKPPTRRRPIISPLAPTARLARVQPPPGSDRIPTRPLPAGVGGLGAFPRAASVLLPPELRGWGGRLRPTAPVGAAPASRSAPAPAGIGRPASPRGGSS